MHYADFVDRLKRKIGRRRLPLAGHVELTYRCNFRCVHCYQTGAAPAASEELSTAEWMRVLDEAAAAGCLWLTVSGGDPLVRRDFADLWRHAVSRGFLVTLFTNGALVTDETADLLAAFPPHLVEITLYGASPAAYGAVTGREQNHDGALAGIERLRARGVAVHLKTVVLDGNAFDLGAMEAYAARRGMPFRFEAVVHATLGGLRGPTAHRVAPAEAVALEGARPRRVAALREYVNQGHARDAGRVYQCGAGRWFFGVDPAGRLRSCPTVVEPSFSLREMAFPEAWRRAEAELSRPFGGSPCARCDLIDVCPRCPGLASMEVGDPAGWSPYFGEVAERRVRLAGGPHRARCLEEVDGRPSS